MKTHGHGRIGKPKSGIVPPKGPHGDGPGMHGRHPSIPVQSATPPANVASGRDAVSMAEGMQLDKPTAPPTNRFQAADAFRLQALQKAANGGGM